LESNNQTSNPNPNSQPTQPTEKTEAPLVQKIVQTSTVHAQPVVSEREEEMHSDVDEAAEKKQHRLVLLEAALYVAGRPLDINEACAIVNSRSKKRTEQLLETLRDNYASRNTAMEILKLKDDRFVMQIKAEFTPLVKKLVNRPLLSSGPLKTLSYIAYRQPITSKRVIEVRGQHAYGHIKILREMGLISPERNGRVIVLKTTDYFADYFGLMQDTSSMKRELKRIFGDAFRDEPQPQ
jgi:segregation and condensation protein B